MTDRIPEPVIIYEVPSEREILDEAIDAFCREIEGVISYDACREATYYLKKRHGWRWIRMKAGPRRVTLCKVSIDVWERKAIIRKTAGGKIPEVLIRKLAQVLEKYDFDVILDLGKEE